MAASRTTMVHRATYGDWPDALGLTREILGALVRFGEDARRSALGRNRLFTKLADS
jgi:hypothetical protein